MEQEGGWSEIRSEVTRDHIVITALGGMCMLGDRNTELTKTALGFTELIFK